MQMNTTENAGTHEYWNDYVTEWQGNVKYLCPNGCLTGSGNPKKLNPRNPKKGTNTARTYVKCSDQSYNGSRPGCGGFFWLDEEPSPRDLQKSQLPASTFDGEPPNKRQRGEGGVSSGAVYAVMPNAIEAQLADIQEQFAGLHARLEIIFRHVAQ